MAPQIQRIQGGFHAHGQDFAVFGRTEDEARLRFREAEALHAEILTRRGRPLDPTLPQPPSWRSPTADQG